MKYQERIMKTKNADLISQESRNRNLYTVMQDASLKEALDKIIKNKERAVAITDASDKVLALLTERDVLDYILKKKNVDIEVTKAIDAANTDFFSVKSDETVQVAIEKMNYNQARHAIILEQDDKYSGWIKREDIVKTLREMLR